MAISPSDQERKNEEQFINHSKDNTDTNKNETSVIANCINNNFDNIKNSAMKETDNTKEIIRM